MSTAQYLPTRLGSRETGLSAIIRRRTTTQKRWLNPERSVGRFICKVGNQSIWEAQGEARETFEAIAPDIKRYLDSCVEPIPSWVTWSMYMMGHAVGSACPTIVFCCDVSAHRREVRDTIKHSGILDRYPGVKTGHMPRAPDFDNLIPLAAPKANSGDKATIQLQMSHTALGMPLFITGRAHGQQFSTKATIGGVIRVGGKYFYTTAAHPFQRCQDLSNPLEQADFGNQSSGDVDDDSCSFDGDSDINFEVESEFSPFNSPLNSPLNTVLPDETQIHNYQDLFRSNYKEQEALEQTTGIDNTHCAIPRSTEEPNPNYESYLSSHASMGRVEFDYCGEFFLTPRDSPGTEADFALLEVTDSRHWTQNVVSTNAKLKIAITSLSDTGSNDIPSTPIQALTSRGNIQGSLSGTPFYARAPNDRAFQKMLCGLYGHIVAGSPSSGTAIIKLFKDVFEHIQYRTGYLPSFPTMNPNENFLGSRSTSPQLKAGGVSSGALAVVRGDDELNSLLNHTKFGTERNTSTGVPIISNSSHLPDMGGLYSASKDVIYKGKAIQSREPTAEEWMKPLTRRFQLNTREGHKPQKLVYPVLLHPYNGPRFQMVSMDSRLGQCDNGQPSYPSLLPQLSLSSVKESKMFCRLLSSLSRTPLGWENAGLLDEALRQIPLGRIYDDAETEFDTLNAIAMSIEAPRPDWGYQECVEEKVCGALRVELYQCTHTSCSRLTRFPRYTDPWVLMETRRGRVGEWVHVFSLFCCAIGSRARWVWSAEDYLWVEVYSKHVERWVHVDILEGTWDNPVLYSERWGKPLSYCIAFSTEGAVDVTRRYVRKEKLLKPRNRCSELTLFYILKKITAERRNELSKEDQERLRLGDAAEQKELQTFHVLSITRELIVSLAPPLGPGPSQQRPKHQGSKNTLLKHALEKWPEDTRKLMNDYCEWDSVSPRR
ncbi:hypothetical protein E0Z10_g9624 [Xylaria hypoxylon]|uniref:Rad4/PNGase transglutaminase-like fold domain-containing protein n=1 Tax=Xylaria hypoxylon TaxID=37992 RepID=A0A4Z0YIN8_9PEZI|nr:hypothetical protein E0Z10_g9624 [Xylaria hypoxylon]